MNNLDEWEELMPEGKRSFEVKYEPIAQVPQGRLIWQMKLRDKRVGGVSLGNDVSFANREFQEFNPEEYSQPLNIDIVSSSIEQCAMECFRELFNQYLLEDY
jgi:hypothetical protein